MSWGLYEIGRANGYEEGRASTKHPRVVVDHSAVHEAFRCLDWEAAKVDALRRAIADHPDRELIQRQADVYWPWYYGWRRLKRIVGGLIKLAGWLIALNLICSVIFGY